MRLERVEVARLRGASAGFKLDDVAPGLNLILGPNGSGKSSLCAALRSMLWPDASAVPGAELVAWWIEDGDPDADDATRRLRGELRAPGRSPVALVEWQRDGSATGRPDVPPSQIAPVYTLGLRDLLETDHASDRELALRIRIEMSGGFDIRQVRSGLSTRFGQSQETSWRVATQVLDRLIGDRRRLAEDDDRLESLRESRERAEEALREIDGLASAVELAGLREELAALAARLDDLDASPEVLEGLRGDEAETFDMLVRDRASAREECQAAARAVTELETDRRSLGLPEPRPDEDMLHRVSAFASELLEAGRARREKESRFVAAQHEAAAVADSLAGDVDVAHLAGLAPDAIDTAAGWVGRALRHATRRAELLGKVEAAGAPRDGRAIAARADELRRRADVLREWLASPVAGPPRSRAADVIWLVCGLAVGVTAYWTSLWVLLPAGAMAGFGVARLLVPVDEGAGARAAVELRWRGMPETGDTDTDRACGAIRFEAARVRETLAVIDARLAHLARSHEEAIALDERRRDLVGLDDEAESLAEDRAALAKRIGIDPGLGNVAFAELLDRVGRFRAAEAARVRAGAEHQDAERVVEALRERLLAALPEGSMPRDSPVPALLDAAERLVRNCERDASLARELTRAREQLEREGEGAQRVEERLASLLARAGQSCDATEETIAPKLARLLDDHAAYREIVGAQRAVGARIRDLERTLAERPELLGLEHTAAAERLAATRTRAEQVGALVDEIARIEERIEAAVASGDLEASEAAVAHAETALSAARDELADALAGDFLLDEVEAEFERHTQPALLKVASELFARFTHHRYRLEVGRDEAAGAFRAIETESGRGLGLGELSDGTRMQLLLAARLAFAIHAEASQRPPIFLDEALTASDPERFRSVAEALLELAEEGRQIFYLTCNPADVSLFAQVSRDANAPDPRVFDLAGLRALTSGFGDRASLALAPRASVPEPGDDSPERYGLRLDVPTPQPEEGVDALHLFHLLRDDLPTLHRLIDQARVERVGHWRSLRASPAIRSVLDTETHARIDAAVGVAERYLEAFAIGRGRRVDRDVLEETGAVSKRYIDRMAALAREVDGDARALLDAVGAKRVRGFRAEKLDELRDALEASGHLDPAPPLDAEVLRARALAGLRVETGEADETGDSDAAEGAGVGLDLADAQRVIDWLETLYRPGPVREPRRGE